MICLSFDTDHMNEERMSEFLDTVALPGTATFFCTERYACMAATRHELGPHPFLLPGSDWDAELNRMRQEFPEAKGWRSHSCVYSHMLGVMLARLGYSYASTHGASGNPPLPFQEAWGLWQLPIHYMDNADFSMGRWWGRSAPPPFSDTVIEQALADVGVYVFGFHPVHVLLNTPTAEHYLERREAFLAGAPLQSLRFDGFGTADFLDRLRGALEAAGRESVSLASALESFVDARDLVSGRTSVLE